MNAHQRRKRRRRTRDLAAALGIRGPGRVVYVRETKSALHALAQWRTTRAEEET